MKEKSTNSNNNNESSTNNHSKSSSSSAAASSNANNNQETTTTNVAAATAPVIVSNNSSADPYNSNNFMAPPIGGIVKCVTCLGNTIEGKVIAYDQQTKMLALRSNVVSSKTNLFDYSMINVNWCSNLQVVEEPTENPEPLSNLNIQKLERRRKLNIDNKLKEINSLGIDVSPLAQHLYFTIYKTLNEVEWDGKNIVVMESVVISPPYDVASCHSKIGDGSQQAVEHVKKIVKKFTEEYSAQEAVSTS